jgi:hypothetical protein
MPNYPSFKTTPNSSANWRLDLWENDLTEEYNVVNVEGETRHVVREPYKSKWRKRKDRRYQNKLDLKNGKQTPATEMMQAKNITGKKAVHERIENTPPKPEHKDTKHQYYVLKNGHWVMNKYSSNECRTTYADVFYGPKRNAKTDEEVAEMDKDALANYYKTRVKVYRDMNLGWLKNMVPGETFEAWLDKKNYPKLVNLG